MGEEHTSRHTLPTRLSVIHSRHTPTFSPLESVAMASATVNSSVRRTGLCDIKCIAPDRTPLILFYRSFAHTCQFCTCHTTGLAFPFSLAPPRRSTTVNSCWYNSRAYICRPFLRMYTGLFTCMCIDRYSAECSINLQYIELSVEYMNKFKTQIEIANT